MSTTEEKILTPKRYTVGEWALSIVFIIFISLLLNIFPLFILIIGIIVGVNYYAAVKPERKGQQQKLSIGNVARGIFFGFFGISACLAPPRAVIMGLLRLTGWQEAEEQLLGLSLDGFLDAWMGVCGVILAMTLGLKLWYRGLKLKSQIENLPTSTARGAAIGLAEFKGVARMIEDAGRRLTKTDTSGPHVEWQREGSPILFEGIHLASNPTAIQTTWSRFYLEDDSGRILIDPRAAEFWDGSGNFIWRPVRCVYLAKRYSVDVLNKHTRLLLPGDDVYVIGNVEVNTEAAADAADEERLVVRPSTRLVESGVLTRLLYDEGEKTRGSDVIDIFFLTDLTEFSVSEVLTRSLRRMWVWTVLWVVLSLALTLMYWEHLLP